MLKPLRPTHPDYDTLSQHADRVLKPSEAMEINGHLVGCKECREEVDFMVDLRARLRGLGGPPPPEGLLDEILSLRDQGDRVNLDDDYEDPEVAGYRRARIRRTILGVMVAIVASVGFALIGARGVDAGASRLEFSNALVELPILFEYRTAGTLADEPKLVLRGEYFESTSLGALGPPSTLRADLTRRSTGRFDGRVVLPPATLYARFAVEDPEGEVVETGGGVWERLQVNEDGQPTLAALVVKAQLELIRRDVAAVSLTTDQLFKLYPDKPQTWSLRWQVAKILSPLLAEEATGEFRDRLHRFAASPPTDHSPDELASLSRYAFELGELETWGHLLKQLQAGAPDHPEASLGRVRELMVRSGSNPAVLLETLEADWALRGAADAPAVPMFLQLSRAAKDPAAAVRWFDRWTMIEPLTRGRAAALLATLPVASSQLLHRLAESVAWLEEGRAPRPLGVSKAEHDRSQNQLRQRLLKAIAAFRADAGEAESAYEALSAAAELGWDPELFAELADLASTLNHPEAARAYYMYALVDPIVDDQRLAEIRSALSSFQLDDVEFETLRFAAVAAMHKTVLGDYGSARIDETVLVTSPDGVAQDLYPVVRGQTTIIQVWAPRAARSIKKVRSDVASCGLRPSGQVGRILLASDRYDDTLFSDVDLEASCSIRWFVDGDRQARNALQNRLNDEILVLDFSGAVRYRGEDLEMARRVAVLLADAR